MDSIPTVHRLVYSMLFHLNIGIGHPDIQHSGQCLEQLQDLFVHLLCCMNLYLHHMCNHLDSNVLHQNNTLLLVLDNNHTDHCLIYNRLFRLDIGIDHQHISRYSLQDLFLLWWSLVGWSIGQTSGMFHHLCYRCILSDSSEVHRYNTQPRWLNLWRDNNISRNSLSYLTFTL